MILIFRISCFVCNHNSVKFKPFFPQGRLPKHSIACILKMVAWYVRNALQIKKKLVSIIFQTGRFVTVYKPKYKENCQLRRL